jgi:hypothetical protein
MPRPAWRKQRSYPCTVLAAKYEPYHTANQSAYALKRAETKPGTARLAATVPVARLLPDMLRYRNIGEGSSSNIYISRLT